MADLTAAEQYEKETEREWGQYVAIAPIMHDGVLAANIGDPIPASNVAKHRYDEQGLVAKTSTKAAEAAVNGKGA